MANITSFLPRVRLEIVGCIDAIIVSYLRDSMIEFCDKSWYWQETLPTINVIAGTALYLIPAPADALISDIISVRHNDIKVSPTNEDAMDDLSSAWRSQTGAQAIAWIASERNLVTLYPIPSVAGTLKVKAALKPSQTATTIPDQIFNHYLDPVAAGAKWKLMAMPGMEWSNPSLSLYYRDIYMRGISDAKMSAIRGYNRSTMTINPSGMW